MESRPIFFQLAPRNQEKALCIIKQGKKTREVTSPGPWPLIGLTFSTSGGCGNSAVRCTCAACFPSPPTSLFSPVVLRLRTTLLLSRTLLSSPDDAAVSSRPPPSRTSPPPAADGLPATVLLRQLLPAHEALTHRLEGLLRGMRVRLIIWDFCLYCCGSILMRYCFSPSPLFLILW